MTRDEFERLVRKHGGWSVGDIPRFPTAEAETKFAAELERLLRAEKPYLDKSPEEIG